MVSFAMAQPEKKNDKEDHYKGNPVLQEISVSYEKDEMSLFSHLFGIRSAGGGKIRRPERGAFGFLEDLKM